MRTQKIRRLWILALVLLVMPAAAQVNGVSGISSVSGELRAIQPPASVADGSQESDTRAFIFLERENYTLENALRVDITEPGFYDFEGEAFQSTIRAGSVVNSYLIHVDPSPRFIEVPLPRGFQGSVTFDEPIIGIIVKTASLIRSSDELGAPNTIYIDMSGLEFTLADLGPEDELDFVRNYRTINFEFRDRTEIDQIRVITSDVLLDENPPNDENSNGSTTDDPVARDDDVSVRENRSVTIDVLDNDSDSNGNIVESTLRIVTEPESGSVSIDSSTHEVTYSPDTDFTGRDSFEYEICDETSRCDRAIVSITVNREGSSGGGNGDDESPLVSRTILPEALNCTRFDEIEIDIVPWNRDNKIRLNEGPGITSVAILGTQSFPVASCVDISTVQFGPTGTEEYARRCGAANVNFDSWIDLLCDFRSDKLQFELEDTMGELQANLIDGQSIAAVGAVSVVESRRVQGVRTLNEPKSVELDARIMGQQLLVRTDPSQTQLLTLRVFDSAGERVIEKATQGGLLRAALRDQTLRPLANGVYLVVLEAVNRLGEKTQLVKKISVLR